MSLSIGHFKGYERVARPEPGQVDLLVRENVLEDYGMPAVDFDNLSRMYTDDLGLEAGLWALKLFHGRWSGHVDRPLSKLSLGYHILGTNTIHSAVWSGGNHFSMGHGPERTQHDQTDTMRKLIRQSIGVSEGRTRPFKLAVERAAHALPPAAAVALLPEVDVSAAAAAVAATPIGAAAIVSYHGRKQERRETREVELYDKHKDDIVFPRSPY